jgi:hypothetical protein
MPVKNTKPKPKLDFDAFALEFLGLVPSTRDGIRRNDGRRGILKLLFCPIIDNVIGNLKTFTLFLNKTPYFSANIELTKHT